MGRRYERHGLSRGGHRAEYWVWRAMIRRCHDRRDPAFVNYGRRGIRVCRRWRESFAAFMEDVGERPSKDLTIERVDNDRGYEPGNVRWATRREQSRNKRGGLRTLTVGGVTKPLVVWAEEAGISRQLLRNRIDKMGWSPRRAVETPVGGNGGRGGR